MPRIPKGKKRVTLTVNAENWDKAQALAREVHLPRTWLSAELDAMLPAMIAMAEALKRTKMTEKDALNGLIQRFLIERKAMGLEDV